MSRCTGMSLGMSRSPGMNGTSSSMCVLFARTARRPAVIPLACPVMYRCSALVQLPSRMLVAGVRRCRCFGARRCDSVYGLAVITSCLPAAPS
jgi:hypothetical protein